MGSLDDLLPHRAASADQPLAGLTLLLVEDSRLAAEGVRMFCRRSGARLRRADSLATAERHLRGYRPDAVIVDLHLPDGSGLDLIARLAQARPRVDLLLALSGDPAAVLMARTAGADAFLSKPLTLAAFQTALLSRLPADRRPPVRPSAPRTEPQPDSIALREDLEHAATLLRQADAPVGYVAGFLRGVARSVGDSALAQAAEAAARGTTPEIERLARTLQSRLATAPRP